MQRILEKTLKGIIALSFITPFIVLSGRYIFPFIFPKIIFFRSLVLIMLGIYLILLASDFHKYKPKFSWLNLAILGFFVSFVVSTFVGVDWYRSFWDSHERMLGAFTMVHYFLYYFIVTSVVKEWKDWKSLFRIFLLSGAVVMFIGVLQKYVDPELLLNKSNPRVSATLGNSIYFSGYGLFLFFVGALLAIKENLKEKSIEIFSLDASWFWLEVVSSLLGLWGIFLGGTRGALLALLVGIFILGLVYFFNLKGQTKIKKIVLIIFAILLIILGILFVNRKSDFVSNLPAVGRLLNTEVSQTNTRVMAWEIALESWQEKPVLGWGPNNYYYAYNKYYKPEFLEYGFGETWFDNAHSVIMNTLAVQGFVGLALYLSIFIIATIYLLKRYKESKIDVHILAFSIAFLWAHLVSIATVFDNPTSYLYFFFFLAFVVQSISKSEEINSKQKKGKNISVPLSIIISLLVLLFVYSTDVNPSRSNEAALALIKKINAGSDFKNEYDNLISIPTPHIDDIRNDISRILMERISAILRDQRITNKWQLIEPLYNLSSDNLEKNIELHPQDIRVILQLSQLKIYGAVAKQDANLLGEAEKLLEESLEISPKRQQTKYMLAGVKENLHKYDEAVRLLQETIDNDPKIANGWQQLESLYRAMGENEKVEELHKQALEAGIKF